jgi:4a-hydroxytetrahydrobiopterin dehydratase
MNNNPVSAATEKEIQDFITKYPEWKVMDNKKALTRSFPLKSYFKGLSFLQSVGWLAQKHNHHPDLELTFSQLTCTLTTHDIGNIISNRDLFFAELIEKNWF